MLASLLVLLAQQSFVLLLGLNECFLEEIGVYMVISMPILHVDLVNRTYCRSWRSGWRVSEPLVLPPRHLRPRSIPSCGRYQHLERASCRGPLQNISMISHVRAAQHPTYRNDSRTPSASCPFSSPASSFHSPGASTAARLPYLSPSTPCCHDRT